MTMPSAARVSSGTVRKTPVWRTHAQRDTLRDIDCARTDVKGGGGGRRRTDKGATAQDGVVCEAPPDLLRGCIGSPGSGLAAAVPSPCVCWGGTKEAKARQARNMKRVLRGRDVSALGSRSRVVKRGWGGRGVAGEARGRTQLLVRLDVLVVGLLVLQRLQLVLQLRYLAGQGVPL